jgi:hypothetical protein
VTSIVSARVTCRSRSCSYKVHIPALPIFSFSPHHTDNPHTHNDMTESQNNLSLPAQAAFFQNGLAPCPDNFPEGSQCSICIEDFEKGEDVVQVLACPKCYFHMECLKSWFNSSHAGRGTCPNDRTRLFTVAPTANDSDSNADWDPFPYPNPWTEVIPDSRNMAPYLARADRRLADFRMHQDAATTNAEIIHEWRVVRGDPGYEWLRPDRMHVLETTLPWVFESDGREIFAEYNRLDAAISAELTRVRARYYAAVRQVVQEHFAALSPDAYWAQKIKDIEAHLATATCDDCYDTCLREAEEMAHFFQQREAEDMARVVGRTTRYEDIAWQ